MKVGLVTTIIPETHYSRYLASALEMNLKESELIVLADNNADNRKVFLRNIYLCWPKTPLYWLYIIKGVWQQRVTVVHLQHEINMFGGLLTAAIFPILPLTLRFYRRKVVTTLHAVVDQDLVDPQFLELFLPQAKILPVWLLKSYFHYLYRLTASFSHRLIVHSPQLKTILLSQYGCPSSKVEIIPIGVPATPSVEDSSQHESLANVPYLLYFGYLHPRKSLEDVIKGFAHVSRAYPQVRLVLAGGTLKTEYESQILSLISKEGLEHQVLFLGFVEKSKLDWLMANALFVVQPAKLSIAASGPLAEVIAHHKPVIASRVGVMTTELIEGEEGLLVGNSPGEWFGAMSRLIDDKALQKKMSQAMRKKQEGRSWSLSAVKHADLYKSLG